MRRFSEEKYIVLQNLVRTPAERCKILYGYQHLSCKVYGEKTN